jgi:hypothetical protein
LWCSIGRDTSDPKTSLKYPEMTYDLWYP